MSVTDQKQGDLDSQPDESTCAYFSPIVVKDAPICMMKGSEYPQEHVTLDDLERWSQLDFPLTGFRGFIENLHKALDAHSFLTPSEILELPGVPTSTKIWVACHSMSKSQRAIFTRVCAERAIANNVLHNDYLHHQEWAVEWLRRTKYPAAKGQNGVSGRLALDGVGGAWNASRIAAHAASFNTDGTPEGEARDVETQWQLNKLKEIVDRDAKD